MVKFLAYSAIGGKMYRKWISAMYVINIVFQSFLSLVAPIGLSILFCYLATMRWGAPAWIYVPAVILATFSGIYFMVRFILNAMRALDSLEKAGEKTEERRRLEKERDARRLGKINNDS